MDKIDVKILNLLQEDASRTNAELADLVALSPSSCLRRVQRLKKSGVIQRTVALLDPSKAGRGLKALATVELEHHGESYMRAFLDLAVREQAVTHAYSVSGQTDVVLLLSMKNMEEYEGVCDRLFRDRTNVARFYTLFVLRTAKEVTAIPLEL